MIIRIMYIKNLVIILLFGLSISINISYAFSKERTYQEDAVIHIIGHTLNMNNDQTDSAFKITKEYFNGELTIPEVDQLSNDEIHSMISSDQKLNSKIKKSVYINIKRRMLVAKHLAKEAKFPYKIF